MNLFGMGPMELILILVIALLVFGPGRLPEVGSAIGRGIREFRRATQGVQEGITRELQAPAPPPAPPPEAEPEAGKQEQRPAGDNSGEQSRGEEETRD